MGLTTTNLSRVRPYADEASLERAGGHQIDWTAVSLVDADSKKYVKAGTVMGKTAAGLLVPRGTTQTITVAVTSNVATATLVGHGYSVGDVLIISGASLAYANGTKTVATVADADTFTYAATGANGTATGTIVASRTAIGLLETDAVQNGHADSLSGYSLLVGGVVYETLLPDATGTPPVLAAATKAELTAAGCSFKYVAYADSRAS
jgi:hypothetical protein